MAYPESKESENRLNEPDLSGSYTAADYLSWKLEEMVELIRGKIFRMSPAPNTRHQRIYSDLYKIFLRAEDDIGNCSMWQAPTDVYLVHAGEDFMKTRNVVQPDIFIACDPTKIHEKGCFGAPDFVVEILSPSTSKKDASLKLELYREYGVREYWMISVEERMIFVYLLNESGEYVPQKPAVEGQEISPRDFPQIIVELTELFKKLPEKEN